MWNSTTFPIAVGFNLNRKKEIGKGRVIRKTEYFKNKVITIRSQTEFGNEMERRSAILLNIKKCDLGICKVAFYLGAKQLNLLFSS